MESILIQVGAIALSAITTGIGVATYSHKKGRDLGKMEVQHTIDTCRIECNQALSEIATVTKLNAQSIKNHSTRLDDGSEKFQAVSNKIDTFKDEITKGQAVISERLTKLETSLNGKSH